MKKTNKSKKRRLNPSTYIPAEPIVAAFQEAENLFATENYADALTIFAAIVQQDKNFSPALRQLGICELRLGHYDSAIKHLVKYCKRHPDDAVARASLAQSYRSSGELVRARQQMTFALKACDEADFSFLAAEIEELLNEPEKAIKYYLKGLKNDPDRTSAQIALAGIYKNKGDFVSASELLASILDKEPGNIPALSNLGTVHHAVGAYESAIALFLQALSPAPHVDVLYNLGLSHQQLRQTSDSIECFQRALELNPNHTEASIQLAESQSSLGNFNEAKSIYRQILSAEPTHCRVSYLQTQIEKYDVENGADERDLKHLKRSAADRNDQSLLNFALAKLYDDTARYDEAFEHVDRANKLRFKSLKKASKEYIDTLKNTIEVSIEENAEIGALGGHEPQPIFIVGMPRSGTTLLEKFICQNNEIASCGELDYFGPALFRRRHGLVEFAETNNNGPLNHNDLLRLKQGYLERSDILGNEYRYFVDKTPDNFKYFTLLRQLFPKALFIHCKRHPLDTCLSIYFQLFEGLPYSYDLDAIGECYETTEQLIATLKSVAERSWFTQRYEDLINDPTMTAARLSKFLDTSLNPAGESSESPHVAINTMSKWQARQRVYPDSINRWENYAQHLSVLRKRLGV